MTTPELDHLGALRAAVIVAVLRPSPQPAMSAADAAIPAAAERYSAPARTARA